MFSGFFGKTLKLGFQSLFTAMDFYPTASQPLFSLDLSALAAKRSQSTAEVTSTHAVDDEVEGRIGRDDEVAEVEVVEVGFSALVVGLGQEVVEQLVDVGRSLRHEEDDDDDEHHEGDVVALATVVAVSRHHRDAAARPSTVAVRLQQLPDEADVEEHQQAERTQIDDQAVENVLVDDLIRLVHHQLATTVFLGQRK